MKKIFKYPLRIGFNPIEMPNNARIVHVGNQVNPLNGTTQLCLWAEVSPDTQHEIREYTVHGTGHEIPEDGRKHVASVISDPFVWHVYELARGK